MRETVLQKNELIITLLFRGILDLFLLNYKANSSSSFLTSYLPSEQDALTLTNPIKVRFFSFLNLLISLTYHHISLHTDHCGALMFFSPIFILSLLSLPIVKIVI